VDVKERTDKRHLQNKRNKKNYTQEEEENKIPHITQDDRKK
jgi:hypothetical protein